MLSPELVQLNSESQFVAPSHVPSVTRPLRNFFGVYQTAAYAELESRADRAAQEATTKDSKLREKTFFVKFT